MTLEDLSNHLDEAFLKRLSKCFNIPLSQITLLSTGGIYEREQEGETIRTIIFNPVVKHLYINTQDVKSMSIYTLNDSLEFYLNFKIN